MTTNEELSEDSQDPDVVRHAFSDETHFMSRNYMHLTLQGLKTVGGGDNRG